MNSDAVLSSTYHRGASPRRLILFAVVLANLLYSTLAVAQILGTGHLNAERRSHTATLLENGKVLIVGGDNQNGIVSQAEIFDPVSQVSALAAALITARTDHSATRLSDGRVLVIGGRDQTASLQSSEVYNPLTTSFVAGPAMMRARSGHTATILANDKILVTGGDLFGSAEIYDPVTQSFSLLTGSLITPRKFHSAILLQNGQVMIVGGVNAQGAVLNTAEVFDPTSQTFYLPPTDMQTPRAFATLKLLSDGKVQIIGGDAELSMEVLDPTNGIFIAKALLPPNADLLGATLSTQSRAALFSPLISQDPILQGILTAEQLSLLDRADQSITELPERNLALVVGGVNSTGQVLNSAKLVSSSRASVTTDKTDYAPGQIVTITGSGFQPNEQVDIYFHEFPEEYPDVFLSATANQQGNFVVAQFAPQEIDLGRIFTLTAIGKSSNFTAQTAFKDAKGTSTTLASSSNPSTIGQSVTFTATVTETGGGGGTAGALVTVGSVTFREGGNNCSQGTVFATSVALNASGQATATKTFTTIGTLTIRACYSGTGGSAGTGDSNSTLQQVINAPRSTTTAVSLAPSTVVVGQASTVTATVTDTASGTKSFPSGTVTLSSSIGNDAFGGACVLAATATLGISSCSTTVTPASASLHTISAGFTAMGVHSASSGSAGLTVNKRPITITADAKSKFYGDADPALTYQITSGSLKSGDTITGALTRVTGENFGTYAITQGTLAISDGNSGNNYDLTFAGALLTINKRPITITADAKSKFYGDTDPALTYQITSGSLKSGDTITGALTRVTGENFGTYAITQGILAISDGNSGNNYDLTFAGALLTINKRPITITADAKSKFYGDADPALTYQITSGSLKSGDTITGALTRVAGENVGTYAISQGTLAISDGNSGNNYDLTFVGALLTINKRPITLTADAKTKIYSESDPALTYQVTSGSLVFGDIFTGALSRVTGELVGTYAIQQGTLGLNNNYILTYIEANLTITTGFAFNGFHSPVGGSVENGDGGTYANPVKSFKLGSTIPVKFGASWLNGGGALITGIHTLQAIKYSNSTVSEPAIDATPTDAATTGNQFRLTSTDWHFNLSTKGNGFTAGTWLLSATLVDGSQHTVWISIKK